jgi:tol-pal system protein YbgF
MGRYLITFCGLALCAGPLFAQDFIDLERERLEQTDTSVPIDSAPASAVIAASTAAEPVSQGPNYGELYYQMQLLQQEVMELRGQMEEQTHELRQLKQQNLERYLDIDRRLSEGSGGSTATTQGTPGSGAQAQELAGEADAYRNAYSMVRSQQFSEAVISFKQFLQDFPDGKYAANAHYWLGELYLVIVPPDLELSRREFTLLLEQHPDNSKAPDAMYKLGKVYFEKGNREKAREYLDKVISEYGSTNSSAVKLARDFLSQNF